MNLEPWTVHSSSYLINDRWMRLRADRCETGSGVPVDPYYVLEPPNWVHVAAFDQRERLLMVRQYRHGTGAISLELPCGVIEPGEAPEAAMRRELQEETGATVEQAVPLATLDPNPARQNNKVYSFLATGTRIVTKQNLDPTEYIEFEFVELEEVMRRIEEGEFRQAIHLSTFFLALRKLSVLQGIAPG